MKPTVKDIARRVGVSPATVSNAFNGRKGVSDEIRQSILEAARELGYIRDTTPVPGRRSALCFVVFRRHGRVVSDTPFFSSLIEGIEKECRAQGFELTITHLEAGADDFQERTTQLCLDSRTGILLLATEAENADIEAFSSCQGPLVLLDADLSERCHDAVVIGNVSGAATAVRYLIGQGHRKIGHLRGKSQIRNFVKRHLGYLEAMLEASLEVCPASDVYLETTLEGACEDMKQYLSGKPELPSAFFADNDIVALGAIRALQECGFRVPEDVSVVGFDNMPFCEIASPRLTTVRVEKHELGAVGVRRLIQRMEGLEEANVCIEMDTGLVVRESVRVQPH